VVDAHPYCYYIGRAILQLGAEVNIISAGSGKEAMERIMGDSVDMLITNMLMPGVNGLKLIEQMQSNPDGCPAHIISITALCLVRFFTGCQFR